VLPNTWLTIHRLTLSPWRLRLVRELNIELADRERLAAKRAFDADLFASVSACR
jgi:hypothetical protein